LLNNNNINKNTEVNMPTESPLTLDQLDLYRRERLALSKLTEKEKVFCEVYIRTFNKKLALKEAGYWTPKHVGGSQETMIERDFERIIVRPHVQEYIHLLRQSVASRLGVSMDDIIDEYKSMAFTSMDDYIEWTDRGITKYKSSKQLTKAQKAGILEFTQTETKLGTTIKIKLHNKQTALDRLFEVLKELEEHEVKKDGPAKISQTQINVMLQDPLARRAIEYFAETMFTKQISLVGTDKDRVAFEANMAKITKNLMETTNGAASKRGTCVKSLAAPEGGGGEDIDQGDHGDDQQTEVNQQAAHRSAESPKEIAALGEGESGDESGADAENGRRYDIPGL
jgi:phage terminase small subunit